MDKTFEDIITETLGELSNDSDNEVSSDNEEVQN